MVDPLVPSAGVRVLLERAADGDDGDDGDGGGARYLGALITPEARFDYRVTIDAEAAVHLEPVAPDGPTAEPRAVELLRAIARTVARHALAATPPSWPRRVLRWRPLP